jgi:hypothetical protein
VFGLLLVHLQSPPDEHFGAVPDNHRVPPRCRRSPIYPQHHPPLANRQVVDARARYAPFPAVQLDL